jgi:glycosyltransferase involved in cell wall biosynthesis
VVLPWRDRTLSYPHEVHHRLRTDVPGDPIETAEAVNSCVDVVSIQYHPDIWGGPDSTFVLEFARALARPAVVTLHAVTSTPTPAHRALIAELADLAVATVVMSEHAAALLPSVYGVDAARVTVIPHGAPDVPMLPPEAVKDGLGVAGRDVILSFGLLSPRKGIERMLGALPAVIRDHPRATYVVVGATHPDTVAADGEAYRASLVALATSLRLREHVQFIDRFAGRVELIRWLQAADVVVAPYTDTDQGVSGTVATAIGIGRPVVATPFPYAVELLGDGRGILVPEDSPDTLADDSQEDFTGRLAAAVSRLLADAETRADMGRRAHEFSREMTWTRVGARYAELFERAAAAGQARRVLPTARPDRRRTGMAARR